MGNRSSVEGMAGATGDLASGDDDRGSLSLRGSDISASGRGSSESRPSLSSTGSSGHGHHSHRQHQSDRHSAASRSQVSERSAKMSYYQMAKLGYQQLVRAIIRPPRCKYSQRHLGPSNFTFCGKSFARRDFELFNMRNQLIMCSMWEPAERQADKIPCIVYMHGNSSGRVEALAQLSLALSLGCILFAFDFAGSGQSEGEYVSLGLFEKDDLQCVLDYLRCTAKVSTIALWGRSMGAATAIMHGASDATIAGMILDSSFADLQLLAQGMVDKGKEHGYHVPSFVVKLAIRMIRSSVLKEAGFDIKDIAPINYAPQCFSPALFASGINDNFVPPKHSELLHDVYGGEKAICMVEGDHNSPRTPEFFQTAASFLMNALIIPDDWILGDGIQHAMTGSGPWSMIRRRFDTFDAEACKQMRSKINDGTFSKSATATSAEPDPSLEMRPSEAVPSLPLSNNQVLFDEILALSLVSENDIDIGMTSERQQEIQRSIMTMLGDRTQLQDASGSQKRRGSKMTLSIGDPDDPPAPPASAGRVGGRGDDVDSDEVSADTQPPTPPESSKYLSESGGWDCAVCTLHNTFDSDICLACSSERSE